MYISSEGLPVIVGDVTCIYNNVNPEHCLQSERWNPTKRTHNKL